MASNFRVLIHRNDDNLHLKLVGDFDGTSAYELLDYIRKHYPKFSTIFIHTDCLKRLIPFGVSVFNSHLGGLDKKRMRLVFTGENAAQFSE
ncbi:MAG: hypothetical protein WAL98_20850 [Desulfatiglandaceae bacterium]